MEAIENLGALILNVIAVVLGFLMEHAYIIAIVTGVALLTAVATGAFKPENEKEDGK